MTSFVSIVIPIYNEEGNILPLISSIESSCQMLEFEIIAVNDGSMDASLLQLKSAASTNKHIKIVPLKRNFGQTAALPLS